MDAPREGCQCLECKGLCGPPCGMWYGVHHMAVVSPGGGTPAVNCVNPGSSSWPSMAGSLPRCEDWRVQAGVQPWPQRGVESPASQQYYPG